MDFKEIYRGELVRTTTGSSGYFLRREVTVLITFSAGSIAGVEQAYRAQNSTIQNVKTIANNIRMAQTNNPVTGAIIIMNVTDEDKMNHDLACERLRAAFFRMTREYGCALGLTPDPGEDAWLTARYLDMFKDASDNLVYALTD